MYESKKILHFITLARIFLLFAILLSIFSCQTKVATDLPAEILKNTVLPAIEALNFETFISDSLVVKYHMQTPRLLVFDDPKNPYKDFPDGFVFQKYDLNRKIISQMSGNHGKYFELQRRWEANGNVVLVNIQGDTLRSEELKYSEADDLISSDKFVSIKKGDQYFTGDGGFKSDAQMSKWSFFRSKGHVYVKEQ